MATIREIGGPNGHLANMRDFTGNSLSGEAFIQSGVKDWEGYHGPVGQLPAEYRALLTKACEAGAVLYIVRSYQTPIAWVITGESGPLAIVPAVTYSATTTKHQSICRAWLAGTAAPNTATP
jgi:hypothetical protein